MNNLTDSIKPAVIEVYGETETHFSLLNETQQNVVVSVHAIAFKISKGKYELLERIFKIGNLVIIFGVRETGATYCRVHKDSVDIMKLLIKTYLKK